MIKPVHTKPIVQADKFALKHVETTPGDAVR